jgi:hypothetical protein
MSNEDFSALEAFSGRIVTQVCTKWGRSEFESFASDLIIDHRGDRKGLPKEVLSELLFLYALHLAMFGHDPQDSFKPFSNEPKH